MRRTAASWLVEVAAEFGLHQETLFLATALLDRFLSAAKVCARPQRASSKCCSCTVQLAADSPMPNHYCDSSHCRCLALQGVPRTQLQLVGVACMLIAAKHEEVNDSTGLDGPALLMMAVLPPSVPPPCRFPPAAPSGVHYLAILHAWSQQASVLSGCAGDAPFCAGLHQHCRQLLHGGLPVHCCLRFFHCWPTTSSTAPLHLHARQFDPLHVPMRVPAATNPRCTPSSCLPACSPATSCVWRQSSWTACPSASTPPPPTPSCRCTSRRWRCSPAPAPWPAT